jgi:hypothetical protein
MGKIAVFNDTHGVGYQIACWMLKDLGYDVYVAGESFGPILPKYYRGRYAPWTREGSLCSGIMEWQDMPKDALFLDTFIETEGRLRAKGFTGPYLIYWILPVWPDYIGKAFRPGKNVGVLAFNYGIGREIAERKLCPVEFLWPPYHKIVDFKARESFDPFLITVVQNLRGWGSEPLCARLRDNPLTNLELYGGGPPDWSKRIPHQDLVRRIGQAVALFHPKPTDTPGYALMEAILQAVPVILMPDFLRSTESGSFFRNDETCFIVKDEQELHEAVEKLKDPTVNKMVGTACRDQLLDLANWDKNRERVLQLIQQIS